MDTRPVFVASSLAMALVACSGGGSFDDAVCAGQSAGVTSDGAAVTVCQKLFSDVPLVRLPPDDRTLEVQVINGAVDLDMRKDEVSDVYHITDARFIDRMKNVYHLVGSNGAPITETSPLMQANKLPSNRAHFIVYEARGAVSGDKLRLDALRPIVLVTGRAMDERFLGAWEGGFSFYEGDRTWSPTQTAKVRLELTTLVPTVNMPVITPDMPLLPDGTRFKATGTVVNAQRAVRLSTGECAASLTSLGPHNPLLEASNSAFALWRFPAMHTPSSQDYHVVNDYPADLYPSAIGMAIEHNFHLADYIGVGTAPIPLEFHIHGNPIQQFWMKLTPVQGGGGSC